MTSNVPAGLQNIGNTWFANSVIQWLLQTPEMRDFITEFHKQNEEKCADGLNLKISSEQQPDGRIKRQRRAASFNLSNQFPSFCCSLCGIKAIVAEMQEKNGESSLPLGLKDIISKVFGEESFFGHQQDAHEFLVMLLHSIENSKCLKDSQDKDSESDFWFDIKANSSIELNEVFEGDFTSVIKWDQWKTQTETKQKFQDISLVSLTWYILLC